MEELMKQFGDKLKFDKDISPYFTLKTKAVAEYYVEAESRDDIIRAVKIAHVNEFPVFFLGGGSNIAVLQDKIQGLVIRNMYARREILSENNESAEMVISSGYPMGRLVKETTEAGLSGFEYHLGLPGTLGGGLYMNSKWTKNLSYIGDNLLYANIIDRMGYERRVNRDYFEFAYDYSILQKTKEIVLEGVFTLQKEDPEILKQRSQDALAYRHETQPFGIATGGCFFQNISEEEKVSHNLPTKSAGYLIDKSGLKGHQIGAFKISDKHANFVINTGNGTPEDLKKMLQLIKATVKQKFGVQLKEEVILYP